MLGTLIRRTCPLLKRMSFPQRKMCTDKKKIDIPSIENNIKKKFITSTIEAYGFLYCFASFMVAIPSGLLVFILNNNYVEKNICGRKIKLEGLAAYLFVLGICPFWAPYIFIKNVYDNITITKID